MRVLSLAKAALAVASGLAYGSTFSPTKAPAYPLAVRSPYLNCWFQGDSGPTLPGSWPRFWTGQILGWAGIVSVDGSAYTWMGNISGTTLAQQVSVDYTSTKTIFTFDVASKVTLTVTFFSPVFPKDLVKQSQQFSYITVNAKSSDGVKHGVQVYTDVSGEWASGNLSQILNWDFGTSGDVSYHKFYRANQATFAEDGQIAAWGSWYLTTQTDKSLTKRSGFSDDVRAQFVKNGTLDGSADPNFRAVNDHFPVFAFARDLGQVDGTGSEVVFSLGLTQDQVISFAGSGDGMTSLPGLWKSSFANEVDAMVAFYDDHAAALTAGTALDDQIQRDSVAKGGQDYATITTLAVRQAFGALQPAGTPSKSYIFLKEISSNSDIQTVDVIFPAFPILVYLNPELIAPLLDPLYENQESGKYPNKYAIHDLGTFPNAKGYPAGNDEAMPLEECGNMIIMTLAYANRTGDVAYLKAHYKLLSQWAQFLVDEALIPANQLSTDDFAGTLANQTNLALKGIIGLKAMSHIAQLTGNSDTFGATADDYISKWQNLGINRAASPPHTTLAYNNDTSHGLLYNLYADRVLGLNLVPQSVYDMQSAFYPTVAAEYGVPLDTRHSWTKSDWQMFAAAVAGKDTQTLMIGKLASWIGKTGTGRQMTDLYDAITGGFPDGGPTFVARPVVGGLFALLALP